MKREKYSRFCESCGHYYNGGERCPDCGSWDTYENTAEGAAASVRALTKYEQEAARWTESQQV